MDYNFIKMLMKKILKEFYHKIHQKEELENNNINWFNPNGRIPVRYINRRNILILIILFKFLMNFNYLLKYYMSLFIFFVF
jgi:hypothetical protein